ncbi:2-keto-4-pentenoate hydratase/2-oxohepta-3-ene-1,7-dioic acid hydratase in catechol pathway [Mumia flava]|uniref:2-keto-4-pentenoate hydratase/2-oxohepta-3-ene-1,7-dioic acid hydratase in catechol pathway n=1 Tax=Mumia flava TaxID=1348852 RepID=A0A0B2BAJ0_9ACTN|nr:fumarylacetoacetate hydrolase family protein [Mumia flava]PJJ48243.1 2-keto-4-pentenoate hydratase/2-oxohepta-3-ene-1,7-dioic acid hydratase in catechol pathway [Mumia flava]
MRFTRILHEQRPRWARIDDEVAHVLDASPIDAFAEGGDSGGARTPRVETTVPLASVHHLPPVVPPVFYAVGWNYRSHVAHGAALGDAKGVVPTRPEVGYRANNALTGHRSPIVVPDGVTGRFEAEGEVVAVIGRRLRRATREEVVDAIVGWTIGNDVSAREWQHADRTFWRSKNSDTFKPMGPWIETDVDPMTQKTTVRVDGEERASFATGDMIFDAADYLVEASRYITVNPGDVLWMGADTTCPIAVGQTVEIEISGIGTLTNPVVAETTPSPEGSPA